MTESTVRERRGTAWAATPLERTAKVALVAFVAIVLVVLAEVGCSRKFGGPGSDPDPKPRGPGSDPDQGPRRPQPGGRPVAGPGGPAPGDPNTGLPR